MDSFSSFTSDNIILVVSTVLVKSDEIMSLNFTLESLIPKSLACFCPLSVKVISELPCPNSLFFCKFPTDSPLNYKKKRKYLLPYYP